MTSRATKIIEGTLQEAKKNSIPVLVVFRERVEKSSLNVWANMVSTGSIATIPRYIELLRSAYEVGKWKDTDVASRTVIFTPTRNFFPAIFADIVGQAIEKIELLRPSVQP